MIPIKGLKIGWPVVGKAGLEEKKKEEILVFPLIVSLITNSNGQDVQANAHEEANLVHHTFDQNYK